jgi:hypothetical protein
MKYGGMTVNERLYVAGVFYEFEAAVKKKDVEKAKDILRSVELNDDSIISILQDGGLIKKE